MKCSILLVAILTLGVNAQTTITVCESYPSTTIFTEYSTVYYTGDANGGTRGNSSAIRSGNSASLIDGGIIISRTTSRSTTSTDVTDGADNSRTSFASSTTTFVTSTRSGTSLSRSTTSGVTASSTDSTASSPNPTASLDTSSSSGSSSSSGISSSSSTPASTSSSETSVSSSSSTSTTIATTTITTSATSSTIIPPLPIRIAVLPRACQDLYQSAGSELENGVAVCLSALRPIVQINSEASECLSSDSITEATVGLDIVLCLNASLLSAAVGPTSSATIVTTTSTSSATSATTTSISSTTSTLTIVQTTTSTSTSSSATTSPASPTCGATGCSNGSGAINVSAGRTLAQCNSLCDADILCTAIQFDQDAGTCTLLSLPMLLVLDLDSTQACATLFYDESCDIPADPTPGLLNGGFEDLVDAEIGVGGITAGGWTLSDTNVRFSANSAAPAECVETLPDACIALDAQNGLALLLDVPICLGALGLNLNAEASICLDTSVIGLVTTGQSIVNCLNAAAVCPRGSTYSTPAGSNFVTVFADPGQLYSVGQTIDNVPTGLGNENTIIYSYDHAGTSDPNNPTSRIVNVLYAGDIIDDFELEASGSGCITRSQTFFTDSTTGELVLQVDCSASTAALRDVLFDDISITSRPILEVEGAT